MRVLDLSLKHKWFDMIAAGAKKEEYREVKPFYNNRFKKIAGGSMICQNISCDGCVVANLLSCETIKYDVVRFHRGQGSRIKMLVEWKGLEYGYGDPNLGAPVDREVWIIKLGRILIQDLDYQTWEQDVYLSPDTKSNI